MTKKITLISGHYLNSKRKAGFHWLADAYHKMGYEVLFITAPISWASKLKNDYRFEYPVIKEANRLLEKKPGLFSYVLFTFLHPFSLRNIWINRLTGPLVNLYKNINLGQAEQFIKASDVIIFESIQALILFEKFKQLNPSAKFIYRVSDDARLMGFHPKVIEEEARIVSKFNRVSVPSQYIFDTHKQFNCRNNMTLDLHGLKKSLFDKDYPNPYNTEHVNLIFVGNSHFDYQFITIASDLFQDWRFHIIGPIPNLPKKNNIIAYGEIPYPKTVAYIKHANIGLLTLSYKKGAESFTDSLKTIQYTYCQLPIAAPSYLSSTRTNMFYYEPGDSESIRNCLEKAYRFDKSAVDISSILTWRELANRLLS
jgi:2-beta-glucuronyltransferase